MRRLITIIVAALLLTATANAASRFNRSYHQFGIGVRGGVSSALPRPADFSGSMGFAARADVEYTYYFDRRSVYMPFMGIHTGLSLGYSTSGVSGSPTDQYTTHDASGDRIDYTIKVENAKAQIGELQMQIPLMFAFLYNGIFFNAGAKMAFPLYGNYTQTVDGGHISAYYEPYGVTLVDKAITGKMPQGPIFSSGSCRCPVFKLYASLEAGYVYYFKHGPGLGIGAYFDYGVFSAFKKGTAGSMVSISQVGADPANPAPTVEVNSVTNSLSGLSSWEAGIKIKVVFGGDY